MSQFNNFRRPQNWGSQGVDQRQGLLPNPNYEPVQNFGCRQSLEPNFGGNSANMSSQRFNSRPESNNFQSYCRTMPQQQHEPFVNANFNLVRQQPQFFSQQQQQQQFNPKPELQRQPQAITSLFAVNTSGWRTEKPSGNSDRNFRGDNWKGKKKNQRYNKSKPAQSTRSNASQSQPSKHQWGKKRQRNPSRDDKTRKNKKSTDDDWNRSDDDGSVYVIDDDMEEIISANKDSKKPEKEINKRDNAEKNSGRSEVLDETKDITAPRSASPTLDANKNESTTAETTSDRNVVAECPQLESSREDKKESMPDVELNENYSHQKTSNPSDNAPNSKISFDKNCTESGPSFAATKQNADLSSDRSDESALVPVTPFKPSTSSMQDKLDEYPSPLIGVNYIVEHQSENVFCEPKYDCNLCDVKCDGRSLLAHVTGSEHRLTYMMKHHKEDYDRLSNSRFSKDEFAVQLIRAAERIQRIDGRGQLQIKNECDTGSKTLPPSQVKNEYETDYETGYETADMSKLSSNNSSKSSTKNWVYKEQSSLPQFKFDALKNNWAKTPEINSINTNRSTPVTKSEPFFAEPFGNLNPDLSRQSDSQRYSTKELTRSNHDDSGQEFQHMGLDSKDQIPLQDIFGEDPENLSLSRGSLGALLTVLGKCVVKNEEDAKMALQVSNALTESLFKYRIRNMAPEVISSNLSSDGLKLLIGDSDVGNNLAMSQREKLDDRQQYSNFQPPRF